MVLDSHVYPVEKGSQEESLSRGVTIFFVLQKENSGFRGCISSKETRWEAEITQVRQDGWLDQGCGDMDGEERWTNLTKGGGGIQNNI